MWVYKWTGEYDYGRSLYTVGFYTPDGTWEPESDHTSQESAAKRCHYLNGGKEEDERGTHTRE